MLLLKSLIFSKSIALSSCPPFAIVIKHPLFKFMNHNHFSGVVGGGFDRQSHLRTKPEVLEEMRRNEGKCRTMAFLGSRFLADESKGKIRWLSSSELGGGTVKDTSFSSCPSVFLGSDELSNNYWCLDVKASPELTSHLNSLCTKDGSSWQDARPSSFMLSEFEGGIFAQALSVLDWNIRHVYCPSCASLTLSDEAGYKRKCENISCISHTSTQNYSHVRTDMVAIVNVVNPENTKILLGRQKTWPHLRYSCIAGFLEPGESFEACVKREVLEETGVQLEKVSYHSSQPWPFPSQLMIGAQAIARTLEIDIKARDQELEDAQWFDRSEVILALKEESKVLRLPPKFAIAHVLINAWAASSSSAKM